MALQSHPPSNCKHFQHLVNLGATWRHWLSDSAVVLGLMTARRSRPQEKISDFCAEQTPLLESIQPAQRNLQALPHVWATRAANVCVAVRGNRSWFKASRKTWTRGPKLQSPAVKKSHQPPSWPMRYPRHTVPGPWLTVCDGRRRRQERNHLADFSQTQLAQMLHPCGLPATAA